MAGGISRLQPIARADLHLQDGAVDEEGAEDMEGDDGEGMYPLIYCHIDIDQP